MYRYQTNIDKAWPYTVTVAPTSLPLTLAEVKEHLRIGDVLSVVSITRSGLTATVTTLTEHGLSTGESATIEGADQSEYNGTVGITVLTTTTFTYTVSGSPITPATGTIIASTESSQDTYLTILIIAATEYAEKYTKIDFITRTYETLRDCFGNSLEIRRSPLQSITTVEYLQDAVLVTVSTDVYFVTTSNTFPHLALKENQSWPTDEDQQEQSVKITFKSGYGDDPADVPDALHMGLLQHIAAMYENRGDCDENRVSGGLLAGAQKLLPVDAQLIYDIYRVRSI